MGEPKQAQRPLHAAMLLSQLERHLGAQDPSSARLRCCVAQLKYRLLEEAGLGGAAAPAPRPARHRPI